MRNAAGAEQRTHVARAEHVAHHAAALVHVEGRALGSSDAGGILTAVLQHQQSVVEQLVDLIFCNHTHNAAHNVIYP